MKFTVPLFIAVLGFLFYIYYQAPAISPTKNLTPSSNSYTRHQNPMEGLTKAERKQKRSEMKQARTLVLEQDSFRLAMALEDALHGARATLNLDSVATNYIFYPPDSLEQVWMEVVVGKLFGTTERWVLVRRHYTRTDDSYINLYAVDQAGQLQLAVAHLQPDMSYVGDTIFDVNGDGQRDFVVEWYPNSGCCLADSYVVYLQQSKQSFPTSYPFINPVFSPAEGIIRGLEYGYFEEGYAGLYKYQWKGLQVDTLEFIHKDMKQENRYYKTIKTGDGTGKMDTIVLDSIPIEYNYN